MGHRRALDARRRGTLRPAAAVAWAGLLGCAGGRAQVLSPPREVPDQVRPAPSPGACGDCLGAATTAPPLVVTRHQEPSAARPPADPPAAAVAAVPALVDPAPQPVQPCPASQGPLRWSEGPQGALDPRDLCAWLLSIMLWHVPPARVSEQPHFPGWKESAEERRARYREIALDLAAVVLDPTERPIYGGPRGPERTAALLLALAYMESGFARDVDKGPCYRGRDGRFARCDGGKSACMLQLKVGGGRTEEGWTREELFGDRRKCFRAGLHAVRRAMLGCPHAGPDGLLNAYASGSCDRGLRESKARLTIARRFADYRPKPPGDREGPAAKE